MGEQPLFPRRFEFRPPILPKGSQAAGWVQGLAQGHTRLRAGHQALSPSSTLFSGLAWQGRVQTCRWTALCVSKSGGPDEARL